MSRTPRLTNDMRDTLIKSILQDRFEEEEVVMWDMRAAFAEKVYEDVFMDALDSINALPEGWLPEEDDIKVQIAGSTASLKFCGRPFYTGSWHRRGRFVHRDKVEMRVPESKRGGTLKIYSGGSAWHTEYESLLNDQKDFEERVDQLEAEVRSVIYSHTSVKKLLETWPEIEQFVLDLPIPVVKPSVLAIQVSTLNEALGLPKVENAA